MFRPFGVANRAGPRNITFQCAIVGSQVGKDDGQHAWKRCFSVAAVAGVDESEWAWVALDGEVSIQRMARRRLFPGGNDSP